MYDNSLRDKIIGYELTTKPEIITYIPNNIKDI